MRYTPARRLSPSVLKRKVPNLHTCTISISSKRNACTSCSVSICPLVLEKQVNWVLRSCRCPFRRWGTGGASADVVVYLQYLLYPSITSTSTASKVRTALISKAVGNWRSICQMQSAHCAITCQHTSAYVSIRLSQHTSAYVSIRQHTLQSAHCAITGAASCLSEEPGLGFRV